MTATLATTDCRRLRLRAQRLSAPVLTDATDAVATVCGLQAQDAAAAALGVRVRTQDVTAVDIQHALFDDRTLVRTWCMRGTLHLVATEDVPWLLAVFGPVFVARGRTRLADLGFVDADAESATGVLRDALVARGPLTRLELTETLQRAGFEFDPKGQATFHLLRRAVLFGVLCKVAPEAGQEAYHLLNEWVPLESPPDRTTCLAMLAQRYLAAYQPATLADFAAWSGLPMADVRQGWEAIETETTAVDVDGRELSILGDVASESLPEAEPTLRLLPAYDTYLLGYENRAHAVSAEDEHYIWPGGGLIRPTVISDGRAIATWKLDRSRVQPTVEVSPFSALSTPEERLLRAELTDLERFLDTSLAYQIDG
ncbi:winged helix DNA-binding domain-containing protein [Haladaptatus sp. GCM10025707]|uniref:winged helix DNA-binding domain-containing protein n=1 Tax=unclassified Haladaptatus TaxID=2622732 RepID=UPI0023E8C57D|nr:winged helix DNA-binding domain-containing protein [Haladaptatus sp. QDMS2]